jgi:hypothetical protein
LNPAEALTVSRERLRLAVTQTDPAHEPGAARGPGETAAPGSSGPPSTTLVSALLRHWWRRHPWRQAGVLAVQAADALARPVAKTHPVALMAGAAAVGALLVWARPWRFLLGALTPLSASLLPSLLPKLLRELVPPSD